MVTTRRAYRKQLEADGSDKTSSISEKAGSVKKDKRVGKKGIIKDDSDNALFRFFRNISGGPFLSKQGARSLILWSYLSGKDPSILAPYIYPIWTAGASYLPLSWSPNRVTLTGFTLILILYFLVLHKCSDILSGGEAGDLDCSAKSDYEEFAPWLFPTVALLLWGYQSADAMDGRQGKRVSMYVHPSTELFDHGIDGVVNSFSAITSTAVLGLGSKSSPFFGAAHMVVLWATFYKTTWTHLMHGKITFDAGISNPTEGLIFSVTLGIQIGYGVLRFIGLWLRFQHAVIHYTGMGSAMAVQKWPEDHPNSERLQDSIPWLKDPSIDISEGRDKQRDENLIKRINVPLLD
eukprot:g981.t1